jgi:hypothetical protein
VLGGIGPFFGSFEFVRESRRREVAATSAEPREGQVKPSVGDPIRPPAALE